ncbi:DUF2509 family protein [Scandinavium sp. NPDC088450]|uniref:DUF2509 family protein n=1 Tax=Scandinavium sp. NPDC088450 TaxID=3364514 RepID=UPI00384AC22F
MKNEQGMSSLLLVLLMLVLGSLTLQGLGVQHQALLSQANMEMTALQESANAGSLLEWGSVNPWTSGQDEQCVQMALYHGRVCLRVFEDDTVLMMANSGGQFRWLTGVLNNNTLQFDSHGWSDFCPRKEAAQCQLP